MTRRTNRNSPDPEHPTPQGDSAEVESAKETQAVFVGARRNTTDRYALDDLFLEWAWNTGIRDWDVAVRILAGVLKGLERSCLIERRTIRRCGRPTHHGFVLTDLGHEAVRALSGDWIEEEH